ncbi:MAG: hypothetical protein HKN21_03470, partial [Candidatus Eisenbacteria bacterium]|nr:hypothetical protein [Candidatus Eisenbacteria bacterium]
MRIRQPIKFGLLFTFLTLIFLAATAVGTAHAHEGEALAPGETFPQPCLVMPHPLKQGLRPPVVPTAKQLEKDFSSFVPKEGILGTAGRPITEKNVIAILVDFEDQVMEKDKAYFERVTEYLDQMYTIMSDGQLELNFTVTTDVYR